MTKEEKIKQVYIDIGFEWEHCSKYVTEFGVLVLPSPDLKYSLKGYQNLIIDKDRFSSFCKDGLQIQPSKLSGIYNNNCWVKIEEESDLPSKNSKKLNESFFVWLKDKDKMYFESINLFSLYSMFQQGLISHYQKINKPIPPVY